MCSDSIQSTASKNEIFLSFLCKCLGGWGRQQDDVQPTILELYPISAKTLHMPSITKLVEHSHTFKEPSRLFSTSLLGVLFRDFMWLEQMLLPVTPQVGDQFSLRCFSSIALGVVSCQSSQSRPSTHTQAFIFFAHEFQISVKVAPAQVFFVNVLICYAAGQLTPAAFKPRHAAC